MNTTSVVNWSEVFASNKNDVLDFANGNLSFRNFKKRLSGDARKQVLTLEKTRDAATSRRLARRACRYRNLSVNA
jgi:hypothetical protein